MNDVEKLLAAEGIRNIKATYWYAMDTKQWDLLKTVFSKNCIVDFRGERDLKPGESYAKLPPAEKALAEGDYPVQKGPENIVKYIKEVVEHWITVHHGAAPIITITGPDTGKAIWPLFDYIDNRKTSLMGYGHYHETYRKEADGVWRIETLQLTRLRMDGTHPAEFVHE